MYSTPFHFLPSVWSLCHMGVTWLQTTNCMWCYSASNSSCSSSPCVSLAALVPDSVKKELLQRIRAFLAQHATLWERHSPPFCDPGQPLLILVPCPKEVPKCDLFFILHPAFWYWFISFGCCCCCCWNKQFFFIKRKKDYICLCFTWMETLFFLSEKRQAFFICLVFCNRPRMLSSPCITTWGRAEAG